MAHQKTCRSDFQDDNLTGNLVPWVGMAEQQQRNEPDDLKPVLDQSTDAIQRLQQMIENMEVLLETVKRDQRRTQKTNCR